MALDEALLESAAEADRWTLRFYRWSEPTLSLGYFQAASDRRRHSVAAAALVRRSTGGGAILHDRELTYSLTLPAADSTARGHIDWLYFALHETLIDTLHTLGCAAALQPRDRPSEDAAPFLCFQRHLRGDVVMATPPADPVAGPAEFAKVAGSAQRRAKGSVLQHGSVLLQHSPLLPELAGIRELAGIEPSAESLGEAWLPRLADRLHLDLRKEGATPRELARAEILQQERFGCDRWTLRR